MSGAVLNHVAPFSTVLDRFGMFGDILRYSRVSWITLLTELTII